MIKDQQAKLGWFWGKNVFSRWLNTASDAASLRLVGSAFHKCGAASAKAVSPLPNLNFWSRNKEPGQVWRGCLFLIGNIVVYVQNFSFFFYSLFFPLSNFVTSRPLHLAIIHKEVDFAEKFIIFVADPELLNISNDLMQVRIVTNFTYLSGDLFKIVYRIHERIRNCWL